MTAFPVSWPDLRPDRFVAAWAAVIIAVELLAVGMYLGVTDVTITDPLILIYPFVWINVSLWAVYRTVPRPGSRQQRFIGAVVAVGYFLVLALLGGLISPGHALHGHSHATGFRLALASLSPGWSPALLYGGSLVTLSLLPFKVVGYLALGYLVYATVLDAAASVVSGVVGLISCVSCAWPLLGTVVVGLFGSTSAVAVFATNQPYGASTLVFVSAVALLMWRPLG